MRARRVRVHAEHDGAPRVLRRLRVHEVSRREDRAVAAHRNQQIHVVVDVVPTQRISRNDRNRIRFPLRDGHDLLDARLVIRVSFFQPFPNMTTES